MFKKITILAVLIPTMSFAQIEAQIHKQIEKINKGTFGLLMEADPCNECSSQKSASAIFESCIKKVCVEKGWVNYSEIPKILPTELAKPASDESEVEALFDKMGSIKSPTDSDAETEKLFEILKNGNFSMTDDNLDLAFQFMALEIGPQAINWDITTYRAVLNEEKLKELILPLSEKNKLAMKNRVNMFIAGLPSAHELLNRGLDSPDSYLTTKYPFLSKVDAVKKLTADFRTDYERFKETGIAKFISKIADIDYKFPKDLISEIESGKDITEMTLIDLIAKKSSFSTMQTFYLLAQAASKDKIDYDDLRTQMSSPQQISKAIEQIKNDKAENEIKKKDGKISCLSAYRLNLLTLPTAKQVAALNEAISDVKKNIAEKWASKYSSNTQAKIAEYLGKAEFFLRLTKEDYSIGLKQQIQREIQTKTINAKLKIKDRESYAFLMLLGSYIKNFEISESEKETESQEYSDICNNFKISPLNDANYTILGKIQVSYTSAHALEMGKGVLAHELGHGISQIFKANLASDKSSKKHQGFLTCLAAQHNTNGPHYVEEDYADWVAANIITENKACLYPHSFSSKTPQLENEDKNDTHSSNFFRLMHIESVQRGKIPDECNTFLVQQLTPKDFLSCQKLLNAK